MSTRFTSSPLRTPRFERTRLSKMLQTGLIASATAAAALVPLQSAHASPPARKKAAAVVKQAAVKPLAVAPLSAEPAGNYSAVSVNTSAPTGANGGDGSCPWYDPLCYGNGNGNGYGAKSASSPAGISTEYVSGTTISGDATHSALSLSSNGATGGNGGDAASSGGVAWQNGGAAAAGTAGGGVALTLDEGTTTTSANGSPTVNVISNGGNGGQGGRPANYGSSGAPGQAGDGGVINVRANGDIANNAAYTGSSLASSAVVMTSLGGKGGGDSDSTAKTSSDHAHGQDGANGGNGGAITYIGYNADGKAPTVTSNGAGIVALSMGGNGGEGGEANTTGTDGATGGDGGNGGNGGNIEIVTTNTSISARGVSGRGSAEAATIDPAHPSVQAAQSFTSAAIVAQSLGGSGGLAGSGDGSFSPGYGGNGGAAGGSGSVLVNTGGNVTSTGYGAAGIVAQSIGGAGGNGATAGSVFKAHGGNGGTGGDGAYVKVEADDFADASHGHAVVSTNGDDANAIVAQSIGGGGGNGGSVDVKSGLLVPVAIGIGGNGEKGGNSGPVEVDIGSIDPDSGVLTPGAVISTHGIRSAGVVAQSIGGGGGNGGSASATTVGGVLSLSIGGSGGQGGTAGAQGDLHPQVQVNNYGTIQTDGEHSAGVMAQAIGGGGGNGGAAQSLTVGAQVTTAVSVGGNGGSGGSAGNVSVGNHGQIVTEQQDSYGVLAQSIGGGGGNGGASFAETLNVFNSPDFPSVNMTTAVGGKGVSGGNAGNVAVTNDAFVTTRGAGSIGIYGQSVGGGGGNGGDSSTVQVAAQNSSVSLSVAVGGSGGSGGTGGDVSLTNDNGAVMTYGRNAMGMFGQSVGGGGGNGGAASIDTASFLSEVKGGTITVGIGGNGGSGNTGGTVNVNNIDGGSVLTLGDGARGVSAQSIGGSGGIGGASTVGGSGGNLVVNISVAGNGGTGNTGGSVNVNNAGTVLTLGGKADGVFAQSVGGSGGIGGNAAAGGGTDPEVRASDFMANNMGLGGSATTIADGIYGFAKDQIVGDRAIDAMTKAATNYVKNNPAPAPEADGESSTSVTVDVGAAIGGKGGSGGNGGSVTAANSGTIVTDGADSAGIYAQSIGGSGGVGGTAQAVNNPQGISNTSNIPISASIGVGGGGGSAGNGGAVTVTSPGSIATAGAASNGITAQSVGGGGGEGGATVASWQQVHAVNVMLGGNGGANGDGGKVSVSMDGSSNASILTTGTSANGIVAQSIGGGGGMATLMSAAPSSTAGGGSQSDISWLPGGLQPSLVPITVGGSGGEVNCGSTGLAAGSCGNGGEVDVTASSITTRGANAHAVIAQSIGGGGGMVTGATGYNNTVFGSDAMVGNGGRVNVTLDNQKRLTTSGDGSYGVLAQSIGGGGILAGDTSHSGAVGSAFSQKNSALDGNGGDVTITLNAGSTIATSGRNAHGVVAQSIGGGGGLIATPDDGIVMGTAGGSGNSGAVTVNSGGTVQVQAGSGSSAVVLNSDGQSGNTGSMTLNNTGVIWGDNATDAAAVKFVGNGSRLLQNSGFIASTNGSAVDGSGGNVDISNNRGGQLYGNVNIGTETLHNNTGAMWATNDQSTVGLVSNDVGGRINIYGADFDKMADSRLNGSIVSSGTIHTAVDFQNQQAGKLVVSNTAEFMGGDILLTAKTMAPKPVTVLSAGYLNNYQAPVVHDDSGAQLFKYDVSFANNAVTITPEAQLSQAAASARLSSTERSIADHLQAGFTTSMSTQMATNYGSLAALPSIGAFGDQLDRLGNEAAQAVGIATLASSHTFVERMNSCPLFDPVGTEIHEHDCAWTRADGQQVKRDGSGTPLGYEQDNYAVQLGGQRLLGDGWILGGSLGYDSSKLTADANQSVSGHGFAGGLVVKRELGNWVFSGAADYGRGFYDSERGVTIGDQTKIAKGDFTATHFGLHGRVTRYVPMDDWYLKPYADLHVTRMKTSGYNESGADELSLQVGSSSATTVSISPMLEAGKRFDFGNGMTLRAYAAAGLERYNHDAWSSSASFSGAAADAGAFTATAELPDTRYKLNAGVNLLASSTFDVRLEYTGEFASGYRSNTETLKLNYLF